MFAPNEAEGESEQRRRRWAEWTTEDVEVREDSWDEPPLNGGTIRDPRDEPFVAYVVNGKTIYSWDAPPMNGGTISDPRDESFVAYVVNGKTIYSWDQPPLEWRHCQTPKGQCQ